MHKRVRCNKMTKRSMWVYNSEVPDEFYADAAQNALNLFQAVLSSIKISQAIAHNEDKSQTINRHITTVTATIKVLIAL